MHATKAFESLKRAFASTPILIHVDKAKPFILEVDASDFSLKECVLTTQRQQAITSSRTSHSWKFEPTEIDFEIRDKELLVIMDYFEYWCYFLEGSPHQICKEMESVGDLVQRKETMCVCVRARVRVRMRQREIDR